MGLKDTTTPITGDSTKLSIVGGKFTLRVEEGTKDAIERKLTKGKNEGQTVWELKYPALSGTIINAVIRDNEFGGDAEITMRDYKTNDDFTIQFPLESRYLFDLIKRLPNINLNEDVSLEMHENTKKKTRTGNPVYNLHVVQDSKHLRDFYVEWKKDEQGNNVCHNLHGMPDAVEGRKGWNFDAQEEWLLERMEEWNTLLGEPAPLFEPEESVDELLEEEGFVEEEEIPF